MMIPPARTMASSIADGLSHYKSFPGEDPRVAASKLLPRPAFSERATPIHDGSQAPPACRTIAFPLLYESAYNGAWDRIPARRANLAARAAERSPRQFRRRGFDEADLITHLRQRI